MAAPLLDALGDGDGKFRGNGEVLTGRMRLPEDHIPLWTVQRLPQAHAALHRAAQLSGEPRMAPLHLPQHTDRPQSRCGLQHRHNLALRPVLPSSVQRCNSQWLN